ncbi:ferredoxin--NADP reductase 1 [Striga asiatica]|uniref:Ferredoxin--NADP reductase 1 n=1 Tax=Striga asiatica TaxID=4170 RepID=A0A5A7PJY5_STRAF|nr:ferredoxin--NADP reductase 1 [Striga asiatica]
MHSLPLNSKHDLDYHQNSQKYIKKNEEIASFLASNGTVLARTSGDGIGECGDILWAPPLPAIMISSSLRDDRLISSFRPIFFPMGLDWPTNFLIRPKATANIASSMFAKHTRNHPASGHSISASKVGSLSRPLRSIQQKSPAFPFRHPIPNWARPNVSTLCLALSLFALSHRNRPTNSSSDSIDAMRHDVDQIEINGLLGLLGLLDDFSYADEARLREDGGGVDLIADEFVNLSDSVRVSPSIMVPKGFEGLLRRRPLTLMFDSRALL